MNIPFVVVLPATLAGVVVCGCYVRARRIEYRLAMNRMERMEISRGAQSHSESQQKLILFIRCLRIMQTSVVFRRLIKTRGQRYVLHKVLQDYGRRFGLGASVISDALHMVLPTAESWMLRKQTRGSRCWSTIKSIFVPERFE